MASPFSTKAVVLLALLANGPACAQDAGQRAIVDAGPMIPPEMMGILPAAPAEAQGAVSSADNATIGDFLHRTTVQPIVKLARDSSEWVASSSNAAAVAAQDASQWIAANASAVAGVAHNTGDWIAAGSDTTVALAQNAKQWVTAKVGAVAGTAQDTGEWLASSSNAAVSAAQNAGQWIAASSNAAVNAAQNAGQWVATGPNAAVSAAAQWTTAGKDAVVVAAQNTGEWIASSSSTAVASTIGAASTVIGSVMVLEDWSVNIVKKLESHLRVDGEFAALVKESGFALSNIKVGIGIIPELDAEFQHERTLSPAEIAAFKTKVNNYVSKAPAPLGYLEKLVLRRLLKAGEMSGGIRVSELHIDLIPLPGLEVFFDPMRFEEEHNQMLVDAYEGAKAGEKNLKSIEERISRIEAMLSTPQGKK
jgi:hypothetical protein